MVVYPWQCQQSDICLTPMSLSEDAITHVSDTALMVAACRALETESEDGFVRDPFAARLAGERGMAMLRALPWPDVMQFAMGVRSRFIDQLLSEVLAAERIATVLSLGCGLDTRPWRLDLPPELRWIEADFAEMLDYKDARMAAERPRCRRERMTVDVNDAAHRRSLYTAVGGAPALLITEGLLTYLPAATVDALAAESWRDSGIAHWMADITTAAFAKAVQMDTPQSLRNVQAPDFPEGEQILEIVRRHGWVMAARRSYLTDLEFAAARIRRQWSGRPQPGGPPPSLIEDPSGVQRLARS